MFSIQDDCGVLVALISVAGILGGTCLGALLNRKTATYTALMMAKVEGQRHLDRRLWDTRKERFLYSKTGRPSIAPEKLLRALLLQAFCTIRSERQLMEQLDYNLLFRWFVGLSMDAPVWDVTVYSKNRDRLVAGDVAARFLEAVLRDARVRRLLSDEHISVDGTLIEAWALMKSFRRRDDGDDPPAGRNRDRVGVGAGPVTRRTVAPRRSADDPTWQALR